MQTEYFSEYVESCVLVQLAEFDNRLLTICAKNFLFCLKLNESYTFNIQKSLMGRCWTECANWIYSWLCRILCPRTISSIWQQFANNLCKKNFLFYLKLNDSNTFNIQKCLMGRSLMECVNWIYSWLCRILCPRTSSWIWQQVASNLSKKKLYLYLKLNESNTFNIQKCLMGRRLTGCAKWIYFWICRILYTRTISWIDNSLQTFCQKKFILFKIIQKSLMGRRLIEPPLMERRLIWRHLMFVESDSANLNDDSGEV